MKHNPDNLTPSQIETHLGYRLLDESEISGGEIIDAIELWEDNKFWGKGVAGACLELTYRTKLTPLALLCLRSGLTLPTSPCHPQYKLTRVPSWLPWIMTGFALASLFFLIYLFLHL